MQKRKVVIPLSILCGLIVGGIWWVGSAKQGNKEREARGKVGIEQDRRVSAAPLQDADLGPQRFDLEDRLLIDVEQFAKAELEQRYFGLTSSRSRIADTTLRWIEQGKCPYHSIYDRKAKTYIQGGRGIRLDTPKVEIRFRKEDEQGELVPFPIVRVRSFPIWDGAPHTPRKGEAIDLDCRGPGTPYDFAYAARFLLSDSLNKFPYDVYLFGQKYFMVFYHRGSEGVRIPEDSGTAVIEMPEEVPQGKVAVFTVDVTKKNRNWRWPSYYTQTRRKTVNVLMPKSVSRRPVSGSLYDPGSGRRVPIHMTGDGSGRAGVQKLGGELVIGVGGEKDGHLLYYKRRVRSQKVRLPEDADVAVNPEDIVTFYVRVPPEKVPYDSMGLGLLMHADSKLQVGGMEFANIEGWHRGKKKPPARLPMNAPPGEYFVFYGTEQKVIGKITVKKSDAGKTLEVQPLEE
ncbi:MAG: hypothetical protein KGZ25_14525 [Planctomycetes bacterium]|nr:hypothetical protein [Planctomycetota bacterium]